MKSTVIDRSITFRNLAEAISSGELDSPREIVIDDQVYTIEVEGRLNLTISYLGEPRFKVTPCWSEDERKVVLRPIDDTFTPGIMISSETSVADPDWSDLLTGDTDVYRQILETILAARYEVNWHSEPTFLEVLTYIEGAEVDETEIHHLTQLPGNLAMIITRLPSGAINVGIVSHPDTESVGRHIIELHFGKDRKHVSLIALRSSGELDNSIEKLSLPINTPIDIDFKHEFDWAESFKKNGELTRQILFGITRENTLSMTNIGAKHRWSERFGENRELIGQALRGMPQAEPSDTCQPTESDYHSYDAIHSRLFNMRSIGLDHVTIKLESASWKLQRNEECDRLIITRSDNISGEEITASIRFFIDPVTDDYLLGMIGKDHSSNIIVAPYLSIADDVDRRIDDWCVAQGLTLEAKTALYQFIDTIDGLQSSQREKKSKEELS